MKHTIPNKPAVFHVVFKTSVQDEYW